MLESKLELELKKLHERFLRFLLRINFMLRLFELHCSLRGCGFLECHRNEKFPSEVGVGRGEGVVLLSDRREDTIRFEAKF